MLIGSMRRNGVIHASDRRDASSLYAVHRGVQGPGIDDRRVRRLNFSRNH